MPNIDTSKVKAIASEMIDINNRYNDDYSAVEQAINRLKSDWQQPQKVASAAFACFDEIKAKFFEPSITERRELAQFLCDAVGIGYEEAEKTNKNLLEQLFDSIVDNSNTVISATVNVINTINQNSSSNKTADMDNAGIIYNNKDKTDDFYLSGGCVITSITNMYRRQQAFDGKEITITKKDIYKANGSKVSMGWRTTASVLEDKYGYYFDNIDGKVNGGNITISDIDRLISENPSGVMLYAGKSGSLEDQHAILLTSGSNGNYMVVDPIDGGKPIPYEECTTFKKGVPSWKGKSIEEVLNNCFLVAFIK